MTDFTKLSDKELSEAIGFHRRQRNMSRGINEAAHMRQTQTVRLLEAEETRRLEEARLNEEWYKDKDGKEYPFSKPFDSKTNAHEFANKNGLGKSTVKSRPAGYVVEKPSVREEVELDEAEKPNHTFQVGDVVHLNHHQLGHRHYHGTANVDKATSAYVYITHPASKNIKLKFAQGVNGHGGKEVGSNPGSRQGGYMISKGKVHDSFKEEAELDEAEKPNQYIEVTNKFTGGKSYHEVHPSKAFAALNHHNSLWSTKSSRIVSGKEAESVRAEKAGQQKARAAKLAARLKKMEEGVEQIDELSKKTLGSYVKKASTDQYLKGQAVQYHTNKAQTADGVFAKQSKEKHYDAADKALKKASNRDTGIGRAVDRLTKEEVEQIDEISNDLKAKYLDKAVQQRYDRFVTPRNTSAPKLKGKAKKDADAAREKANAKDNRRAAIIDKTSEKLTGKPHYNKMSTPTTPAVHGNTNDWWKGKKYSKEEVEQIDELSKDTVNSYWKKAATARYPLDVKARKAQDQKTNRIRSGKPLAGYKPKDELSADEKRTHMNRIKGMNNAGKRLFRSEEVELDEAADLRITKIYNKWPKPATYAVHSPDRKYYKEFDSMEAAKAHHKEKSE